MTGAAVLDGGLGVGELTTAVGCELADFEPAALVAVTTASTR